MKAPTDENLLHEYLQGEPGSFELLVRRHTPELFRFTLRLTGSSVAAEDAVQDTFLQVHISAESFDLSRRFKPWLFTIAANKSRDYLRKRDRKREVPLDAPIGGEGDAALRFVELLSANNTAPVSDLLLDERRRAVRDVIAEMPTKLSEVLTLAYYHRFPYKDIAEIVEIPLGTVKSRLHAAIVDFGSRYRATVTDRIRHKL